MPGTTEAEATADDLAIESVDSVADTSTADAAEVVQDGVGVVSDRPTFLSKLTAPIAAFFTPAGLKAFFAATWPPVLGIGTFLLVWAALAPLVDTQLGTLPGPLEVLDAGRGLWDQYRSVQAEQAAYYAQVPPPEFPFPEKQTIVSQIWTSLRTVALGFFIGTVIAIPVGLLAGLSKTFQRAIDPLVQLFKPVSPLAWLPIVQLVIAATVSRDSFLPVSFIVSALVVTLNSLWPTLINTAVGASSVDKDLLNVAEVLRLGPFTKLRKIILPSALPYIFTGMRLSLGVGWMVLIAAEMLAQNPGLGKFVWDEFQNGSSQSLSRIMFAVIVIGVIGVILDQTMARLEKFMARNRMA